tara:strand:+ start:73877 stop:74248 length:372 start_codon:yes stop_codon:yes gene_type:complete
VFAGLLDQITTGVAAAVADGRRRSPSAHAARVRRRSGEAAGCCINIPGNLAAISNFIILNDYLHQNIICNDLEIDFESWHGLAADRPIAARQLAAVSSFVVFVPARDHTVPIANEPTLSGVAA